jgi:hypothetical protein
VIAASWTISCLSDGSNDQIADVLATGCAPRLVELLGGVDIEVQAPVLRIIGIIVTGNGHQTQVQIQAVFDANIIPKAIELLKSSKINIQKESCWIILNVCDGGSPRQVGYLVQMGDIEPI